ncbi:MAG: metallopeptidase family protein [Alphaproteobacteria bacterium]
MAREHRHTTPPSLADVDVLARRMLECLPEEMRRHVTGLVVQVDDFCEESVEESMGLESPFDLLGLYQGTAVPWKSVLDSGGVPDMIFLYRRPILDYWCECGEDLGRVIRHVLIHEIGHHFGFSDEDMERIEGVG